MKEEDILAEGMNLLIERLQKIPFLEVTHAGRIAANTNGFKEDGLVQVHTPKEDQQLIIEAKSKGSPLQARNVINALLLASRAQPNVLGILIAPYISYESAKICQEFGVGYLDLSGNCWLTFQQVYILTENYPNKFSKRRDLVSLYAPKTERILRVLLSDPNHSWKTVDLQKTAKVSIGLVSYLKARLSENEWIRTNEQGVALSNPQALLSEWAKAYNFNRNRAHDYYTLQSPTEFEQALERASQRENFGYAFTGFSAANHLAPMVRNQRTMAYVDADITILAKDLGLKPVSSGANVTLLEPYDKEVFWGVTEIDGVSIVTPIQVYLDLQHHAGRGEEAAAFLFKEVIEKQWSTSMIMAQTK